MSLCLKNPFRSKLNSNFVWLESASSESQPQSRLCFHKERNPNKVLWVSHCKSLNFTIKGYVSASAFIQTLSDSFVSVRFLWEASVVRWYCCSNEMAPNTQTNRVRDRKREGAGSGFSSLETTFKSRQVSFGIVISFSTFQTHIKVLQLYFRLQDCFYTHHWFCHFFRKNTFLWFKMFASMSVQNKSCYFILFLFWMLYIKKSFRFGILWSPLQSVSYIFRLC